jgi:hypothetical protein
VGVSDGFVLALALVVLALTLAVTVARPPYLPEAAAALGGAVLLVIVGAIGRSGASDALRALGPTVGQSTCVDAEVEILVAKRKQGVSACR